MKTFVILGSFICVIACAPVKNAKPDRESELNQIRASMSEQELSWNNQDLAGFMKWYWKNDSLMFIGSKGLTYGWSQTLQNYEKAYPSGDAMGRLQFTNLDMKLIDEENAYVIGKWELFRKTDTLSGHYSLLWKKMGQSWFIVADHSS